MASRPDSRLQRAWYGDSALAWLLLPLTALYAGVSALRRRLYRSGWLRVQRVEVPVVVVGNLTAGGTGKTPVTLWLAEALRRRGLRPGIVSRGYGGVAGRTPVQANADSDPAIVGDEPLLMAARSRCPVVVHPDRVAAAGELLSMGVDVILSDDGLQHYRLARDFEIAVVDGERGFGNGRQLPAGPLREPASRLDSVDRVLVNLPDADAAPPAFLPAARTTGFHLVDHELVSLDGKTSRSFDELRGRPVHAVAAIGNPERFFRLLERRGLEVIRHPFPDHAVLTAKHVAYDDGLDVVMTEKDAVKCRRFASARLWYLPVDVVMHDEGWLDDLEERLRGRAAAPEQPA